MKPSRLLATVVLLLVVAGVIVARQAIGRSRPQLVGSAPVAGLAAPVTVARDAAGVPTLTAADRVDLARATGFVHAQERFFQMDLLRRAAAGELAALVGPAALELDRARRPHRMRAVAARTVALAHAADVALVQAYADGVNAGLAALGAPPPEYLVLRRAPQPWTPTDTVLATHAMWFDLTDEDGRRERDLARLQAALPPAVVEMLMPRATAWDAPLLDDGPRPPRPALPGAAVIDLRAAPAQAARALGSAPEVEHAVGSNNFAVGGALTADGRAILAGDMHLGLGLPNVWFRIRLRAPGLDVTGVTLPGTPLIVAGSNGRVAWAFTNSYGDWTDLRRLEVAGDRYRTATGWAPFEHHAEVIEVAHGAPETLDVRVTRWGPVLEDAAGTWAVEWLAHRPEATNLELAHAETATGIEALAALAPRIGIPPQNMVMADAAGRVGWTLAGRVPRRDGWREAADGWAAKGATEADGPGGFGERAAGLAVLDPPGHRVWTANARVTSGAALAQVGDGGYDLGARAGQIRDALQAQTRFTEADLLAIQLDDRALFLAGWREALLETLTPERAAAAGLTEARGFVLRWSGRAAADDVGYRLVRQWRLALRQRLLDALEAPLADGADGPPPRIFDPGFEDALWTMVRTRPPHLLPAGHADWDALLLEAFAATVAEARRAVGGAPLARATWGQLNTVRLRHPLSSAVPGFGRLFDLPGRALPGDANLPRVQTRGFGASQRMVVAPGHETDGYFHMPGGQSGHPFAPYYGAGQRDWEEGRPSPFLPGATRWTLTLVPGGNP